MATTFETFKNKISWRIHKRTGWKMSTSKFLAQDIVNHIRNDSGGGTLWKVKFAHGKYAASQYSSLSDFITALENISMPTDPYTEFQNREEFKTLMKKFQSSAAIEAVSSFTERHGGPTEAATHRQKFESFFQPIKNDYKSLVKQTKANYEQWKTTKTISYTTLKAKFLTYSTPVAWFKLALMFLGIINIGQSEVILGILPLGGMGIDSPVSITDIDVSHSNKIVKYRAVGSIYLAHQVGGKDSIKVTGKLQGELRLWYLTALWIMTLLSQGHWKSVDWDSDLVSVAGSNLRDGIGKLLPTQKIDNIVTQDPAYEHHITFPVVTEHEIIPNCYIETFSFEEKIVDGRDVITYDIMMRTYVQPKEFLIDSKRSIMRIGKAETKTEQVLKYGLNFGYRLLKYGKETIFHIESNAWKVKNYYDLDPIDVGFTMFLGMTGAVI